MADMVFRRYRIVVIAGLAAITALAWMYVLHLASSMSGMGATGNMSMGVNNMGISMPLANTWRSEDILLTFLMWAVMMVAMMTPSAIPMILTYDNLQRRRQPNEAPFLGTAVFLLGYMTVWLAFSIGATFVQWVFHSAALLSPETLSVTPLLGGVLLILAGLYQFTPLKQACLSSCRTPLSFLITEWREGFGGELIMGWRHGLYCVGCCWLLMTLLFVAGVMNLLWVAVIAGYVLIEKVAPAGQWASQAVGLLTIGWGAWLLVRFLGV
jgi:predicted metal-binding membrane protein